MASGVGGGVSANAGGGISSDTGAGGRGAGDARENAFAKAFQSGGQIDLADLIVQNLPAIVQQMLANSIARSPQEKFTKAAVPPNAGIPSGINPNQRKPNPAGPAAGQQSSEKKEDGQEPSTDFVTNFTNALGFSGSQQEQVAARQNLLTNMVKAFFGGGFGIG